MVASASRANEAARRDREVASQNCCKYAGCCQSDGVGSLKSCQTLKEAYAVRRPVPPSAEIQASIDELLARGMVDDPQKMLSELARVSNSSSTARWMINLAPNRGPTKSSCTA